jgi:hypothetical protein
MKAFMMLSLPWDFLCIFSCRAWLLFLALPNLRTTQHWYAEVVDRDRDISQHEILVVHFDHVGCKALIGFGRE